MGNVTLTICGRNYAVACADGEEGHISRLGQVIDGKVAGMSGQSEPRTLLFAALLLADELHEARSGGAAAPASAPAPAQTETLEALAERLEQTAARLENAGARA